MVITFIPIKSEGIFPSQNLPVGLPPMKFLPYGGKLLLVNVPRLLLFPVSRIESPNANNAGNCPLAAAAIATLLTKKTKKNVTSLSQNK